MSIAIFTVTTAEPTAKKTAHPEITIGAADRLNPLDFRRAYGSVDLTGDYSLLIDWARIATGADDKTRGNVGKLKSRAEQIARDVGTAGIATRDVYAGTLPAGLPATISVILFQFDVRYVLSAVESLPLDSRPANAAAIRDVVKRYAATNGRAGLKTAGFSAATLATVRGLIPELFDAYAANIAAADVNAATVLTPPADVIPPAADLADVAASVETLVNPPADVADPSPDVAETVAPADVAPPANRRDRRNGKRFK